MTRPSRSAREVALEAAVLADRGEVVDQPEEAEAEHREQHRRAGLGQPALGTDPEGAEHRAAGVDHQHGEDDEQPAGRRQRVAAVVLPFERGRREDLAAHDPQEPHRHQTDREGDDHGHERLRVPVNTTRASTITSALSNTAAIMPGIAMPESFNAKPSTATTSSASAVARAVRHPLEQRVQRPRRHEPEVEQQAARPR